MAGLMRLPAFATCLATFLIARPLAVTLSHNEETAPAKAFSQSEADMALLEIGTHRHLQAIMANMTVQAALARPPSMPAELQAFVSQRLASADQEKAQAFLQAHTSKTQMLAKFASLSRLGTMDAEGARKELNKLALATMTKLDVQRAECMTQQAKQKELLDETGQDVSSFNAQGTTARAQVMGTQTALKRLEDALPQLNQELSLHDAKCKEATSVLKRQIVDVQKDAKTLAALSGMSGCGASFLQTGLLRCHKDHAVPRKSFIAFGHHALRHKAAQLKAPTTRRALQNALGEVFAQVGRHRRHRRGHRARYARHRHHKRAKSHRHRSWHNERQELSHHGHKRLALLSRQARTHSARFIDNKVNKGNTTANITGLPKHFARCTGRSNPDCDTMGDKLMLMQAGVIDEVDGRRAELASTEEDCKAARSNLQDQIKSTSLRLQEQQEMLAEATTITIDAAEQSRVKGIQFDKLEAEHKKMVSFCQDSVTQAASELCKVKSIRQELFKMEQKRPFIQDCEVSAWTPTECSKKCGGGTQNLVRQVIVPDDKGASCPPLAMQQGCNMQECPVNCKMGEWSGWTSCSAKCGGGIKQRIRQVKQHSKHGGKLCGQESESVGCATAACDKECTLAAWTPWSSCSKACGGGFQERVRKVEVPSGGLGSCPASDSSDRLQYMRCNPDKCTPKNNVTGLLKCEAKVDVILLLDGSGSVGKTGWETVKKAGASLVKALDPKQAQVAVLMYSGPKDMTAYKRCTGQVAVGTPPVDLAKDCKMIWVSHLTPGGSEALAAGIGSLIWQKGSTMTSQALASAEAEMVYGRADAEQVVIAIADRLPMMPRRTGEAAASIRKRGKLIWATATSQADLPKFASWASRPAADNVVYMDAIAKLDESETLNKIIAAACPKVE